MIDRIRGILKAEFNDKFERVFDFDQSIDDLDVDEIIKRFTKKKAEEHSSGKEEEQTSSSSSGRSRYQAPPPDPAVEKEKAYYANLELSSGAPFAEIKKSYRRLMKIYHPDLYHNDKEKFEMAQEVSRQINEAYVYFENKYGK